MSMFESISISASALSAERVRMNVIANNLANINTTKGPDGEPYKRKYVIFETQLNKSITDSDALRENGVAISDIAEDQRPFRRIYKPGHPDADKDGYVSLPNIDMVEENVDLLAASRAYDANLSAMKASKAMLRKMIELLSME